MKATPTISNWIQPIAIGSRSNPPRDVDRTDRDPIAIELQLWTALWLDRDPVASVDRPVKYISLCVFPYFSFHIGNVENFDEHVKESFRKVLHRNRQNKSRSKTVTSSSCA